MNLPSKFSKDLQISVNITIFTREGAGDVLLTVSALLYEVPNQ